jgi:uncharacterized protein (TIGR02996 family)
LARLGAHPDDQEAWLVYADWLAEQGDGRGELIALEHRLACGVGSAEERLALQRSIAALVERLEVELEEVAEPDRTVLAWYLPFLRGMRGRWNEGTSDALAALLAEPVGRFFVALKSPGSSLSERHCERVRAAIFARIERAFDGVPVPDEAHRTLYQAEAADNYSSCDRSRDHLGRWQDLPEQQICDNQWALPHLDAQGIHYYLPALMFMALRRQFSADRDWPWILESLGYRLQSHAVGDSLRAHARERFSLLTRPQRVAICTYAFAVEDEDVSVLWARTLEAELDHPREPWFDLFRPDPRP